MSLFKVIRSEFLWKNVILSSSSCLSSLILVFDLSLNAGGGEEMKTKGRPVGVSR